MAAGWGLLGGWAGRAAAGAAAGAGRRGFGAAAGGGAGAPLGVAPVLVANRGEIACRVMRTCRRLGLESVAVFSEADAGAPHARLADRAMPLRGRTPGESYLDIDQVLRAVETSGARAVHPGYGFLSENAAFAEALAAAGVAFVGPPTSAIAAMGDKIASKALARAAGVSTVPGGEGEAASVEEAVEMAREVGFPVMLKASAGGGGRGMRIARSEKEVLEQFPVAHAEAEAAFGDGRMLVERFVESPRHIEMQVVCDQHGGAWYLPERECSVQRRNQKVVEEAPSPYLSSEQRAAMGAQALALCREVGYHSAGTVEFLVDSRDGSFFFLEMNTRLQVEHPVTEEVTGVDLVEAMLRVANGEALGWDQEALLAGRTGWSIEARVCAEDPARGYMPSVGRLQRYREPAGSFPGGDWVPGTANRPAAAEAAVARWAGPGAAVRADSGVEEGGEVSIFYDSMLAKLVTHAPSREAACRATAAALDRLVVRGVKTNQPLLRRIVTHEAFIRGDTTTDFLPEHFPDLGIEAQELREADVRAAIGAAVHRAWRSTASAHRDPRKLAREGLHLNVLLSPGGGSFACHAAPEGGAAASAEALLAAPLLVRAEGFETPIAVAGVDGGNAELLELELDGTPCAVQVLGARHTGCTLLVNGLEVDATVDVPLGAELRPILPVGGGDAAGEGSLKSPMPGTLLSVAVEEGQEFGPGDELATVEAMKMQNVLRAEGAGKVKRVVAQPGAVLAVDEVILEME